MLIFFSRTLIFFHSNTFSLFFFEFFSPLLFAVLQMNQDDLFSHQSPTSMFACTTPEGRCEADLRPHGFRGVPGGSPAVHGPHHRPPPARPPGAIPPHPGTRRPIQLHSISTHTPRKLPLPQGLAPYRLFTGQTRLFSPLLRLAPSLNTPSWPRDLTQGSPPLLPDDPYTYGIPPPPFAHTDVGIHRIRRSLVQSRR